MRKVVKIFFLLFSANLIISCWGEKVSGSDNGTETGKISGKLVLSDGKTPAQNAEVELLGFADSAQVDSSDSLVKSTAITNKNGEYSFKGVEYGSYSMMANYVDQENSDTLFASRGVFTFEEDLNLGIDTLLRPGKISIVVIINNQGAGGVECFIPGTSYIAITGDDGNCIISNIPPGIYDVYFRKDNYLREEVLDVPVETDQITVAPEITLELDPAIPPLPPVGRTISYDSINGTVRLSWIPVNVSDLDGYIIFRDDTGSVGETRLTPTNELVRDTILIDTVYSRHRDDTLPKAFRYRIKSQDLAGDQSVFGELGNIVVKSPKNFVNNSTPNKPILLQPSDSSSTSDSIITLQWSGEDSDSGDVLEYDVYVDTGYPPMVRVDSGITDTLYDFAPAKGETYFWKVVAYGRFDSVSSDIFSFKTNTPPNKPVITFPDSQLHVPIEGFQISWSGGDPDGDSVNYEVFLDTISPPLFLRQSLVTVSSAPIIIVDSLIRGRAFYVQIIADDGGFSVSSDIKTLFTEFDPILPDPKNFTYEESIEITGIPGGQIFYRIQPDGPFQLSDGGPIVISETTTISAYQISQHIAGFTSDTVTATYNYTPIPSRINLRSENNMDLSAQGAYLTEEQNSFFIEIIAHYKPEHLDSIDVTISAGPRFIDSETITIANPIQNGNSLIFRSEVPFSNAVATRDNGTVESGNYDTLNINWRNPLNTNENLQGTIFVRPDPHQATIEFTDAAGTVIPGNLAGTETDVYVVVRDQVFDPNRTYTVRFWNEPGTGNQADAVTVTGFLTELDPGRYIFTSPIEITTAANTADAVLQTFPGDQIVAHFVDPIDRDSATARIGYGTATEQQATINFITEPGGDPVSPGLTWDLGRGFVYLRYRDDPVNGLSKQLLLSVISTNGQGVLLKDPDTLSMTQVSPGVWEASMPITDNPVTTPYNGTLEIYFRGTMDAYVRSHSNNVNTEVLDGGNAHTRLTVAYPNMDETITLRDPNSDDSTVDRHTTNVEICVSGQSFSNSRVDTLLLDDITCSGTGDIVRDIQLIQVSADSGLYCGNVTKNEGTTALDDGTLTCRDGDIVIATYTDPVYQTNSTVSVTLTDPVTTTARIHFPEDLEAP